MLKVVGASWNKMRASTWIIGLVFVFGIIVVTLAELGHFMSNSEEDGNWSATVYWSKESGFEIVFWGQGKKIDEVPKGAARAYYQCHINTTGWAILDIETQPEYPDWVQAFGAGMLEGSLSWQMIDWQRQNTIENNCRIDQDICEYVREYIEENSKWVKKMYDDNSDPYWHQIFLFYLQLEGVQKGFEHGVKRSRAHDVKEMTLEDFLWLNSMNDLDDLKNLFSRSGTVQQPKKWNSKRSISLTRDNRNPGSYRGKGDDKEEKKYKCGHEKLSLSSAFVKLVADEGKLIIAHNSAGHYSSMLKMLKHYQFPYRRSKTDLRRVPGKKVTFSSYPGVIHSMDDFFIIRNDATGHHLVVTGTPLPVFDRKLWDRLSPQKQVFVGPRIMAANRLGSSGAGWMSILSTYKNGTGNKEWIVADLMKLKEVVGYKGENRENYGKKLDEVKGLLYIAEQILDDIHVEDVTDILRSNTYWASYGLPFFQDISSLSGVNEMEKKFGEVYSYNNTPVAKIFRRDQGKAVDMYSVARLMRSNSYKTDPFSFNNPRCAVGGRGDLANEVEEVAPIGVTDTKIFSNSEPVEETNLVNDKRKGDDGGADKAPSEISFQIKAGPPYSDSWNVFNRTDEVDDDDIGPFVWPESKFSEVSHVGHPDVWNFEPILIF